MTQNETDQWLEELAGQATAQTDAEKKIYEALRDQVQEDASVPADELGLRRLLVYLGNEGLLNEAAEKPLSRSWFRPLWISATAAVLAGVVTLSIINFRSDYPPITSASISADLVVRGAQRGFSIVLRSPEPSEAREWVIRRLQRASFDHEVRPLLSGGVIITLELNDNSIERFQDLLAFADLEISEPGFYRIIIDRPRSSKNE